MVMFWQDDTPAEVETVPDVIVDLVFRISGRDLPSEHGHALFRAVAAILPWIETDKASGIHLIHVAESGNGWVRPTGHQLLHLSKRTRLVLRLPIERISSARSLSGLEIEVDGHRIRVGPARIRRLNPIATLFARHVAIEADTEDEEQFLRWAAERLRDLTIPAGKMLCGRHHIIQAPCGPIPTRSLMLAELAPRESLTLQQHGLGKGRKIGCGLFLPQRNIEAVYDTE